MAKVKVKIEIFNNFYSTKDNDFCTRVYCSRSSILKVINAFSSYYSGDDLLFKVNGVILGKGGLDENSILLNSI